MSDGLSERDKLMMRTAMRGAMDVAARCVENAANAPLTKGMPADIALRAAASAIRKIAERQWPEPTTATVQ